MKTVSKIILGLSVFILMFSLVACGNKAFMCDICNKEKVGKSYASQMMGQEVTICEECYKQLNETFN